MPIGMSQLGFLASCAAVETASNPMNAKNTTPAAPTIPQKPPNLCVVPSAVVNSPAGGMYGVWLAGSTKLQPSAMTRTTIATLVITIRLFTHADCWVPRMSSSESTSRMNTAGMFMIPCTPVSACVWNGEWLHWYGTFNPKYWSSLLKYSLQAMATVAAPTAYSSTRSHP